MNRISQIISRFGRSGVVRSLHKESVVGDAAAGRLSVRTPVNLEVNKNVLKSSLFSRNATTEFTKRIKNLLPKSAASQVNRREVHDTTAAAKKRVGVRKKRSEHQEQMAQNGYFTVNAFATAEEYDLEKLLVALKAQNLYETRKFFNTDDESDSDVLFATAKYQVGNEPRGIYFFREGTVIMWNFSDLEISNILAFLKNFEEVRTELHHFQTFTHKNPAFRTATMRRLCKTSLRRCSTTTPRRIRARR